jgi:hypothetical protein
VFLQELVVENREPVVANEVAVDVADGADGRGVPVLEVLKPDDAVVDIAGPKAPVASSQAIFGILADFM